MFRLVLGGGKCLSGEELERLSEHKYSCVGMSVLESLCMKAVWRWMVNFCPRFIAPNLITLIGLLANLIAFIILLTLSPDAYYLAPRWSLNLAALGLFIYQTADNLDGLQARRTDSASPLGELFDHGCDSLTQIVLTLEACIALGLGEYPILVAITCSASMGLFYMAHWAGYSSGKLTVYYFDVTEAQFVIMAILLISGYYGPHIWLFEIGFGIPISVAVLSFAVVSVSINALSYLRVIFQNGFDGTSIAGTSVLTPFPGLLLITVPQVVIFLRSECNSFDAQLVLFCFTHGIVAAKIINNIIIAQMTKSRVKYWDPVLLCPLIFLINQLSGYVIHEENILDYLCAFSILCLVSHSVVVIRQITSFLRISCFRI